MRPSHEGQGVQFCHAAARLKPVPSLSCPEGFNGGRAGSSSTGDVRAGLPRDFRRDKHQPGDPSSSGPSHVAVHLVRGNRIIMRMDGWPFWEKAVDNEGGREMHPQQTESVSQRTEYSVLCTDVHSVGQFCVAHVQRLLPAGYQPLSPSRGIGGISGTQWRH